jgi:short-subunit dehydrogenase
MARAAALITGASSGIGAELAKLCAADGYAPVLVARHTEALFRLSAELAARFGVNSRVLAADLAEPAAPQAVFDALEGETPAILINNAGFGWRGAFREADFAAQSGMIEVNVGALAHLTRLFLPGMCARASGRILNVASTAAFVPGPYMAVYYATKAFVFSFSLAVAEELKGSGVTMTVLCPGPTRTSFGAVAGLANSKLFQGPAMDAAEVARIGYQAMRAGKTEVIAGARNRWMMWGTRFAPRGILTRVTARLNSPV